MNPYQFLKELNGLPTSGNGTVAGVATYTMGGGDGVKVDIPLNPTDFTTAAGLSLTGATTPSVINVETNAIVIQAAASSNLLGTIAFRIPGNYDPVKDLLEFHGVFSTNGTTDAPTVSASAFRKRVATALSTALTVTAVPAANGINYTQVVAKGTAAAATIAFGLSANGLQPGDVIYINLTSTAHTTDAVYQFGSFLRYCSAIVLTDMRAR